MKCQLLICRNGITHIYQPQLIQLKETMPVYEPNTISPIQLLEDASYTIELRITPKQSDPEIHAVQLFTNDTKIGVGKKHGASNGTIVYEIKFDTNFPGSTNSQPFLLQADLVCLSIQMNFSNYTKKTFCSDYIACEGKNDSENVKAMIEELVELEDEEISKWLRSHSVSQNIKNSKNQTGLLRAAWKDHSFKSLNSYIQMLEKIYQCYDVNFAYFRSHAKHVLLKKPTLISYQKVRTVTVDGFAWLMQNADNLAPIPHQTTIKYQDENYLPLQMLSDKYQKNWDVYENQVVMSFLELVCQKAKIIESKISPVIENENEILKQLSGNQQESDTLPIIIAKKWSAEYYDALKLRLQNIVASLMNLKQQYAKHLSCRLISFTSFPKTTMTFREIQPYRQVLQQILHWFCFGEFDLSKDIMLLPIKSMDKLFEYYCLIKLLQMLQGQGFSPPIGGDAATSFEYGLENDYDERESDIHNTYHLQKEGVKATLYYQPVIYSKQTKPTKNNEIDLFCVTSKQKGSMLEKEIKNDYCVPDFLLKITPDNHPPFYAVFDAKFSRQETIKEHYLESMLKKYYFELRNEENGFEVVMLWLLQGRVDHIANEKMYKPQSRLLSFGIIPFHTQCKPLGWKVLGGEFCATLDLFSGNSQIFNNRGPK